MGIVQTKRPRIVALDLIRGAFLMMIIVDHLHWGPSLFFFLSGGGKLPASPAEGFFTISVILVGYIYGPRLATSFWAATKKLWKRATLLYILSVIFTLSFTAIAVLLPEINTLPPLWPRDANHFLVNVLLGRYAYGWADFLPRYAFFMFTAPAILWLITRGKSWVVASSSLAIYALFSKTALFLPFSSWEIIFIPSIIIGYYLPHIESYARSRSQAVQSAVRRSLYLMSLSSFILCTLVYLLFPITGVESPIASQLIVQLAPWFDKETVAVGRLAIGIVWFAAIYLFTRTNEQQIHRWTLGVLETFGKKSLYTYSIHAIVVFVLAILSDGAQTSLLYSTLLTAATLALIYILVVSPHISRLTKLNFYAVSRTVVPRNTSRVYED